MTKARDNNDRYCRQGFTIIEALFAVFFFGLIAAGLYGTFIKTAFDTKAGSSQVKYVSISRIAEQKIIRLVQCSKAFETSNSWIRLLSANNTIGCLYYQDLDNNPNTTENNQLIYNSDWGGDGVEEVLCSYVSPIDAEPIFSKVQSSPLSVLIRFHVGDSMSSADADTYGTGRGYQGVEVRFSASPRNVPLFHTGTY